MDVAATTGHTTTNESDRRGYRHMTEQIDSPAITEALDLIDQHLARLHSREMVKANEVSDLLLDIRLVLTPAPQPVGA